MTLNALKEDVVADIKKITKRQKALFLDVLDKECEDYLTAIDEKKLKHKETLILLKQSLSTIRNAEKNLTSFNFVDSYTLLRSGMEYYIMATMIEEDENVFNEFIKMTKTGKQLSRTYTKPSQLQKRFSEFLYNNDPNITFHFSIVNGCTVLLFYMYNSFYIYSKSSGILHKKTEQSNFTTALFLAEIFLFEIR